MLRPQSQLPDHLVRFPLESIFAILLAFCSAMYAFPFASKAIALGPLKSVSVLKTSLESSQQFPLPAQVEIFPFVSIFLITLLSASAK